MDSFNISALNCELKSFKLNKQHKEITYKNVRLQWLNEGTQENIDFSIFLYTRNEPTSEEKQQSELEPCCLKSSRFLNITETENVSILTVSFML